ncbi:MAG: helix-turn-helix domain-containing protein [Oscillospiraceae bacterium]|nr:helix-turn-helix domain-containing protein [Oscillospiraceae bacterium]MCD7805482.1 helix-turn-helix domain-containing protein [Oscillospiraceae bacterium]
MLLLKNYGDVMIVEEVCEVLKLGKNKVYELLQSGDIASRKVGRKYLIPKKSVIDFLESVRYTSN